MAGGEGCRFLCFMGHFMAREPILLSDAAIKDFFLLICDDLRLFFISITFFLLLAVLVFVDSRVISAYVFRVILIICVIFAVIVELTLGKMLI